MIVVIIFGVTSHSREFHGLTPESDGSTAVKTHNNHYEARLIGYSDEEFETLVAVAKELPNGGA